ncbi:MGMT family protein [Roseofilum reptotaenium CS-1145]|uniref:methylated-DNA--[protein]-cysteine S-methyltransferase n=2 Tax=Roseofilum TaxID=1233426 RepID=A0A1L9QUK9_9CYAN|nr:MGMT family protein [Roseofilum reptotaenium]MDB9517744.1 MGMT family protein [Roseofilum reptotaenium CS-1145]OJJ26385.1 cysteine methyltransferase [Roseofilum reptotaenium AO1-A]
MKNQTPSFHQKCYELLTKIPQGQVTTYKEIAKALNTKAYRAVGNAMARNDNPIVIPCHRVVKSNGEIGNYRLGVPRKKELLLNEGITIKNNRIENLSEVLYQF